MDRLLGRLCTEFSYEEGKKIWNDVYDYFHTVRHIDNTELTNEEIIATTLVLAKDIYLKTSL